MRGVPRWCLLVLCLVFALRGAFAELEEQLLDLASCERSFEHLLLCVKDPETFSRAPCCPLMQAFLAGGCSCPGCDDTNSEELVDVLNGKGMLWMLELAPLTETCNAALSLEGEASLETKTTMPTQPTVTAQRLKAGAGAMWVDEYAGESREAMLGMDDWADVGEEAEEQQAVLASELAKAGRHAQEVSGGVAAEVEGAPKYVMQPEMEEQGEAEWGPAEELDGSEDAFLLSADVLPSSEDFPQSRQASEDDGELQERNMSAGEQAVDGSATNGDEAMEAEDLPQVETQQAERGGEGVLRRTRTIVLDLEMGATADDAAEVVQQVLDSGIAEAAIADTLGDIGPQRSLLRPVSRKVTINIEMEAPKGASSSLLNSVFRWLDRVGATTSPAPVALKPVSNAGATTAVTSTQATQAMPASLQERAQAQEAAHSSAAVHAVRMAGAWRAQQAAQPAERPEAQQLLEPQEEGVAEGMGPHEAHGELCQCLSLEMPAIQEGATPVPAVRYYYVRARLALCKFACTHRQALSSALAAELAACALLLAALLVRRTAAAVTARSAAEAAAAVCSSGKGGSQGKTPAVVCAAAEEWRQPLLQGQGAV
ncbi:hypothetical protein N2152v2_001574 [Parachlorella kessleri]